MTVKSWSGLVLVVVALASFLSSVMCYDADPAYMQKLSDLKNKDKVPEDDIRKWWYLAEAKQRDFPRVFSFCFNYDDLDMQPNSDNFVPAMRRVAKVTAYDPEVYGWAGRKNTVFEKMDPLRIQIQRANPDNSVFNGDEGKTPFNVAQWVDFRVTFNAPVYAFFAQAYGGPLGTPVGQFTDDLRCTHGEVDDVQSPDKVMIVPCHYTPRSAFMWPNVFIAMMSNRPKTKIHFRFRWTETHCHETGYFQFILIAQKTISFTRDHDLILSPIFRYEKVDEPSMVPTPYHLYYDKVTCGVPNHPYNSNIKMVEDGQRIIPNKDYDDCVLAGISIQNNQLEKFTCPPGRFQCSQYWDDVAGWSKQIQVTWWKKLIVDPLEKCCQVKFPLAASPGPPPTTTSTTTTTTSTTTTPSSGLTAASTATTTTTTTTPSSGLTAASTLSTSTTSTTPGSFTTEQTLPTTSTTTESPLRKRQKQQEKYLNYRTRKFERKHQITHGDFCVLVWLVLVPIADNIARFFKDFSEIKDLGVGFWILVHVSLHSLGLILVWWSFGLVVGGGADKLGNVSGRHFFSGVAATILQHVQFITGLKRTSTERATFTYVLIHSLSGYFSHLIAYLAVILSSAAAIRKWISLGLFLVWLVATVAFFFVELRQDKVLGVVLHRAQCPVLQRIMIEGGRPPLAKVKLGILAFLVIGQGSLFVYMFVVHSAEKTALASFE